MPSSMIPVSSGIHQQRFIITDDVGNWSASETEGYDLEHYIRMGVPSGGGTVQRVKVTNEADVGIEILDYPGIVDEANGPHSIFYVENISTPGEHYVGDVGAAAGLPAAYRLRRISDLNFSANILTIRVGSDTAQRVTLLVVVTPD